MDVSQKCLRSFPVTTLSLFIIVTLLNSWLTSTAFSMRSHPWTQRTQIGETDVFISVWRENMLTSKGNLKYGGPSEVTCCFHDAFVHFLLLFKWLSRDFKVILKLWRVASLILASQSANGESMTLSAGSLYTISIYVFKITANKCQWMLA